MNVVIYCRVSTEEQANKDLSIPAQRKELFQYAAKHGYTVVQEFVDEGFSAFVDAITRPEFQAMMRYCLSAKVGAVLVWKFDRFSRRMEDARAYKSLLARKKVKVISINEPISDDPAGFATERLLEMFAELYSRMLGVDTRRGLKALAEQGQWYGGKVAYGYRSQLVNTNGRERMNLVLGPEHEVETVRNIYRWAIQERLGGHRIAKRLNAAGVQGPVELWQPGTIINILRSPLYAGFIRFGYIKPRPNEQRFQVEGIHPAIVSYEDWQAVQSLLDGRHSKSERRAVSSHYLLTGLIWCWCGNRCRALATRNRLGKVYKAYQCSASSRGIVCDGIRLQMTYVDGFVLAYLEQSLHSSIVDQMTLELEEIYSAKVAEYQAATSTASKRSALVQKISRLYDAIESGVDPLVCSQRIATYQRELGTLIDENVEAKLQALERARATVLRQLGTLKTRETSILALSPAVQRELVLTFVERVDTTRDGLKVTIKYTGGGDGGGGEEAVCAHWGDKEPLLPNVRTPAISIPHGDEKCILALRRYVICPLPEKRVPKAVARKEGVLARKNDA